jgi:hypothetical protein
MVAAMKARLQRQMPAYVQGFITSMNDSASLNAGMRLKMAARVLLAQCISIVNFNDPVL